MARVVVNTKGFEVAVEELVRRATNAQPALEAWGLHMVGSVRRNFQEQGRPNPWRPLKISTLLARFTRRAAGQKIKKTGGQFDPNPNVFKEDKGRLSAGDSSAVTTVAGFARSPKTGRVLRSRHRGLNKFAPKGMVFRLPALRAILKGEILRDSGRMENSISSKVTSGTEVEIGVGTNVKYAGAHQFGAPSKGIAARPFLIIQPDDEEEFTSMLTDWMSGEWGNRG